MNALISRSRSTIRRRRDGLHAPAESPEWDALAQQGRKFVADQAVQHTARLLCVHEVVIDLARVFERVFDRRRRNFVEFDAVRPVGELENVFQMPRNRLTLAVRVGRKIDARRLRRFVGKPFDDLLFIGVDDVTRLEVVVDVYTQPLFGQVAHHGRPTRPRGTGL